MLEAFALGILSVEEQTAAAGHLEQCPRCTEALRGKQSCEAVSTTGFQSACLRPLAGNSEMSAVATRRWEPWSASGMPDALDEQARRSFESAWSEGAPQSIEQFLPAADDPRYLATLEELVHIEIEFQWKAWSTAEGTDTRIAPARVEDYLQRFPALRRADCTRRLAAQEFRIRKRHGTRPTPEEYQGRFPGLAPAISELSTDQDAVAPTERTAGEHPLTGRELPGNRYRIVGEIARGGMGVVLRALDRDFDRMLAVKMLLTRASGSADCERRFLDEAAITGQLQHPGIPPAHDIGRLADGRPFFSMKLIEGRTLADLLKERATPATEHIRFLKVFEQVAQTLAYAHSQGIIHRDLKPHNIMVGAFGEVQVMDWGLAKRLQRAPADDEVPADTGQPAEHAAATEDGAESNDDSRTQMGQVLGTFAYMSPEQARGDVPALDERCDVFGLGAILCTILSGRPPYQGKQMALLLEQAQQGKLADAYARLEGCGADSELVQLAKSCLASRKEDRPRDAGEVARAVAGYLASVQDRLQQARVARVEAEVKASEERKRRRLAVGLAAAVVLLVVGFGLAALWYAADQARRDAAATARRGHLELEVASALDEAERQRNALHRRLATSRDAAQLSDGDDWRGLLQSARAAWKRADRLAAGDPDLMSLELRGRVAALARALDDDDKDRQLAFTLDKIRLESSDLVDGVISFSKAAPKVASTFNEAGFDVEREPAKSIAERVRRSPIRWPLVAGLDYWALGTGDARLRGRLLEAARAADSDPWRNRVRQADEWENAARLKSLAREVDCAGQSPQLLAAVAQRLSDLRAAADAVALLRRALICYPRDFWLHFQLGIASRNRAEQIGAFRAALAVRPEAAVAYYNVGVLLQADRKLDEAVAAYRRAVELDPHSRGAHNNLGMILNEQGKSDEAIRHFRQAIAHDDSVEGHINLGAALQARKRLDEAVEQYRRAVKLRPHYVVSHNNLGVALREQKQFAEAVTCLRKAVELDGNYAIGWCNLGHTLRQHGEFTEALAALRRGHQLNVKHKGWDLVSAQWVRDAERSIALEKKLPAFLRGDIAPADGREQLQLGALCFAKKQYAAAARFYAAAFAGADKLSAWPNDLKASRPDAACAAALAAAGADTTAKPLTDSDRAELRGQVRTWLQAAVAERVRTRDKARAEPLDDLRPWLTDPDLASVRDPALLAKLPSVERQAWQHFWLEVAKLCQHAGN